MFSVCNDDIFVFSASQMPLLLLSVIVKIILKCLLRKVCVSNLTSFLYRICYDVLSILPTSTRFSLPSDKRALSCPDLLFSMSSKKTSCKLPLFCRIFVILGCMYKCIISVLTSTINAFAASYHMIASSKVPFDSNVSVLITHPWSPSFLGDKIWVCVKDTTAPCQAIYRKLDYDWICCVFCKNVY